MTFISKEYNHNSFHSLLKEVNDMEEVGLPMQEMHTLVFPVRLSEYCCYQLPFVHV